MEVTLNRHIEITPGVRSGKPRIAGRRITVADVVIMYLRMGQSLVYCITHTPSCQSISATNPADSVRYNISRQARH